jgi:hypothetical protein
MISAGSPVGTACRSMSWASRSLSHVFALAVKRIS